MDDKATGAQRSVVPGGVDSSGVASPGSNLTTSFTRSDSSFVDDLLPPEIKQFGANAGAVISIFSSAKSAVDVATAVLKVLGVLQDTDVKMLFMQLTQSLDNAVGALSWQYAGTTQA